MNNDETRWAAQDRHAAEARLRSANATLQIIVEQMQAKYPSLLISASVSWDIQERHNRSNTGDAT